VTSLYEQFEFVGWLVSNSWLGLAEYLSGCLAGWLAIWLASFLAGWLAGSLASWLIAQKMFFIASREKT
jgi:hypothetical protein